MNGIDMTNLLERWSAMGFECVGERAGQKYWKDVCVYAGAFGRSGLACDWLEEDQDASSVYLKGPEKGQIIGSDRYMKYMKDKK